MLDGRDNQMPANTTDPKDAVSLFKDQVLRNSFILLAFMIFSLFVARAPTSYTCEIPVIGKFIPVKLGAVYVVVIGPIIGMLASGAVWYEASLSQQRSSAAGRSKGRKVLLPIVYFLIGVLSVVLSLQYFLILAPAELCPTRPHFEFLWTNPQGLPRITHCMSGTEEMNNSAPYYLVPQVLQAWTYVISPIVTVFCLFMTWRTAKI